MASESRSTAAGAQTNALGLSSLTALPPDPLLGLMTAFRADPRADKLDLGVGVYKDANGVTPIMSAVGKAEAALLKATATKAYESPRGNPTYGEEVLKLVFGADIDAPSRKTLDVFATPGGCGALGLAAAFLKRLSENARLWISDPSWPNHSAVAKQAGLATGVYAYRRGSDGAPDLAAIKADLSAAQPGDGVIVQGPCHNPTGVDLTTDQWTQLSKLCAEKKLFPIVDVAYQGFGDGLEDDIAGVRAFAKHAPEALITYSCSKNFGLYRDRCGALILKADDADACAAAGTHIAAIARASYSMPPAHGPAIVATILSDPALKAEWETELNAMRERITQLRSTFADALAARQKARAAEAVKREKGMFSLLDLNDGGAARLREAHGVYAPRSGRINVAGLTEKTIDAAAEALATEIRD
ncbi:MAG: amino acid aminotransferase [Pseudomonadota bacterium]